MAQPPFNESKVHELFRVYHFAFLDPITGLPVGLINLALSLECGCWG
jgi:hypothetical protein